MLVNGCDCSIVIKTAHREIDVPYSDETLREAVSFLKEEASIEGDGVCRGLRKNNGVKGCIVTSSYNRDCALAAVSGYGVGGYADFCFGNKKYI